MIALHTRKPADGLRHDQFIPVGAQLLVEQPQEVLHLLGVGANDRVQHLREETEQDLVTAIFNEQRLGRVSRQQGEILRHCAESTTWIQGGLRVRFVETVGSPTVRSSAKRASRDRHGEVTRTTRRPRRAGGVGASGA